MGFAIRGAVRVVVMDEDTTKNVLTSQLTRHLLALPGYVQIKAKV